MSFEFIISSHGTHEFMPLIHSDFKSPASFMECLIIQAPASANALPSLFSEVCLM